MRLAVTSEQNGLERDQTESQECGALVNIKFCKEVEKETNQKGELQAEFQTVILVKKIPNYIAKSRREADG